MSKQVKDRSRGLPANLIQELIAARHASDLTQRELASKVGLPQVHISAIETGKIVPQYNTLLEIVRVLDHDLLLVPRSLVPAVQSLIRDVSGPGEDGERPLYAGGADDDDEDNS